MSKIRERDAAGVAAEFGFAHFPKLIGRLMWALLQSGFKPQLISLPLSFNHQIPVSRGYVSSVRQCLLTILT